jgi:hypothetical protein
MQPRLFTGLHHDLRITTFEYMFKRALDASKDLSVLRTRAMYHNRPPPSNIKMRSLTATSMQHTGTDHTEHPPHARDLETPTVLKLKKTLVQKVLGDRFTGW